MDPHILFGAYAPPAPWEGMGSVVELERQLDRRIDVVHSFQAWGSSWGRFDPDRLEAVCSGGRIPLVTWEPWVADQSADQPDYRLRRITAGAFDAYVRSWARGLRDIGSTVYLRPLHEPNGDWYPWSEVVNGNRPGEYAAAWRHLHDLFAAEGATGVRWVWSPLADDVPAGNTFERYWPGTHYVDVLALGGYNWGAQHPEYGGWRTFDEIFAAPYERITRLGDQPVWITEVGCDGIGGDKAAWVRDMLVNPRYPRIAAIVWFHVNKERDWRLLGWQPPGRRGVGDHG